MRVIAWMAGAVLTVATPALASPWEVRWTGNAEDAIERNVSAAVSKAFDASGRLAPGPGYVGADSRPVAPRLQGLALPATFAAAPAGQGSPRTRAAQEYSDGYVLRRKIHMAASIATLPLFGVEWYLGNKLFNLEGTDTIRSAHRVVAGSIAGLFAVNTVTGVWNLWEGRKDPNGRTKRFVHGLLMLAADAGFVATGATAPGEDDEERFATLQDPTTHRSMAYFAMGTATLSYLMMMFK